MTDDQKISAAARACRDPDALDGVLKIRLAAAASGVAVDDGGDRKILAAAAEAGRRPYDDGSGGDLKIRRAAGQAADDDTMAKALANLAAVVLPLRRPRPSPSVRTPPPRPSPPSPAARLPAPKRAAQHLQPPAQRPVTTPVSAPPLRFDRLLSFDSPHGYWDFRDRLAGDIRAHRVQPPTAERIVQHAAEHYGLDLADAAEWTVRFLGHVQREMR